MHGRLERAATIDLRGFFRTLSADVLAQLRRAGTPSVAVPEIFEPSRWRQPFNAAMLPNWNRALWTAVELERVWIETGDAGRQAVRQIAAVDPDNPTPPPSIHVDPSPEQLRKFREFLKARSAGVWNQVGATTHKLLERTITRGIREGLTFDQMQSHVQATLKSYSDTQARRVARTETTGSIGYGGQVERDEAGIEFKEWISRLDERTRTYAHGSADHLAANGLVVGNAESFQVSGEPLMFPGDAAGSAANIINCRCSAVASLGDGRKRRRPARTAPAPKARPAPPPPRDPPKVEFKGKVAAKFRDEVRRAIQAVPIAVRTAVEGEFGVKSVATKRLTTALPDLKGKRPTGYPEGLTWDHSAGAYLPDEKRLVVAQQRRSPRGGKWVDHDSVAETLHHEYGHAFDHATRLSSKAEAWRAYADDVRLMSEADKEELDYLVQGGSAIGEAVASCFSAHLASGRPTHLASLVRRAFPKLLDVVAKSIGSL